ncbi:hypothetical protein LCGC14_1938540 [marine sediment metagenome]|uniref:Uncharacterized protein n=1 Tax=marine sediment metagenome TaxID=412755 RepID=A0A0F9IIC3_9ZZZZ
MKKSEWFVLGIVAVVVAVVAVYVGLDVAALLR